MHERNIELSKPKELLCVGKVVDNGKAGINWKALQDEFIHLERGDRRKTNLTGLKLRIEGIPEDFESIGSGSGSRGGRCKIRYSKQQDHLFGNILK